MKIYIVAGHGQGDSGACGNGFKEADLTRKVANSLYEKLKDNNCALYPTNRDLYQTKDYNFFEKGSYVLEVHFNAFNSSAYGTELLIKQGFKADEMDKAINNACAKYFENRGIKERSNLANMNNFASRGIGYSLVEVCFIDNQTDIEKFNTNFDNLINDLASVLKGSTITIPDPKPDKKPSENYNRIAQNATYYITASELNVRRSPSLSGKVVAQYTKGSTVNYDSYVDANGYRWVSYIGASGNRNYVARKSLDDKQIFGYCE